MSEENKAAVGLSDSAVETMVGEQVVKIFAKQKTLGLAPKWGVAEHCGLIKNILTEVGILDADNKDDVATLLKALAFKGVGGNAAQFRQWKVVAEKLPASTATIISGMDY